MRHILILALVCVLSGCGSSPTTPSPTPTPTPSPTQTPTPAPQPAPQPAPPPAPVYPIMAGGWSGKLTLTVTVRQTGERATNVCDQSWVVSTQFTDTFTGTWQISGGTAGGCGQAGPLIGRVTTAGAVVGLDFSAILGASSGCTRSSGTGVFAGIVSNNATTVTAQSTDVVQCVVAGATLDGDRLLSLEMTKR